MAMLDLHRGLRRLPFALTILRLLLSPLMLANAYSRRSPFVFIACLIVAFCLGYL